MSRLPSNASAEAAPREACYAAFGRMPMLSLAVSPAIVRALRCIEDWASGERCVRDSTVINPR